MKLRIRHFLSAYFKYAHHPNEEKGVDFWWLDWQQGGITKMEGLDPLWMLNHFHFLDSARNGKRPMTFSRYAGPGSHRYPVGFQVIRSYVGISEVPALFYQYGIQYRLWLVEP